MKRLVIFLKSAEDAFQDFKSAYHRTKMHQSGEPHFEISFDNRKDFDLFTRNIHILSKVLTFKPKSLYDLAKVCGVDTSNLNKLILFFEKTDGTRLIVTYSDKRARKDLLNREKGIRKLRQSVRSGRLTKESINNRGYNKFLTIHGEATVSIDEEKVRADQQWDGLKGYITSTQLPPEKVVENYLHLWQIEKAFRISKTDLKVRPIHHYLKRRIEAHICIAFAAYTIYKELEYLLQKHKIPMSPRRAAELTHTMYQLEYLLPGLNERKKQLLKMDEEQRLLYKVIYG